MPMEPKATGAVLASRQMAAAIKRRESKARQNGRGDRDRGAESGGSFEKGSERERDQQRLQALVVW